MEELLQHYPRLPLSSPKILSMISILLDVILVILSYDFLVQY